jgi:transcriptional regulator with XRE-family HTH domain
MHAVDLIQRKGVGAWLRELRAGRSQRDVAASAGISERTLQRYENDQGPSYEMLRLLDALGVKLIPPPPNGAPRAVGAELADLRNLLAELRAESAAGRRSFAESLESVADSLAALAHSVDALDGRLRALDERVPRASDGAQ